MDAGGFIPMNTDRSSTGLIHVSTKEALLRIFPCSFVRNFYSLQHCQFTPLYDTVIVYINYTV